MLLKNKQTMTFNTKLTNATVVQLSAYYCCIVHVPEVITYGMINTLLHDPLLAAH